MMEIFSNGWSASKSASLVMMQWACPDTANSRNILSLASRQTLIFIDGIITDARCNTLLSKSGLVSRGKKYLSNLGLYNVVCNSSKVSTETSNSWLSIARSNAKYEYDSGLSAARIITFVSTAIRTYFSSSSSLSFSAVSPCFLACSEVLRKTSFQSSRISISLTNLKTNNCLALSMARIRLATSSFNSIVIVFINQR